MNTKQFKGLLEMSELTCLSQEETLLSRSDLLENNLAVAIYLASQPAKR
jgi:hypothetical protein